MVAPPSKKAKHSSEPEVEVLQKTLRQALLSDDASSEALLKNFTGFGKEIIDALIVILKSCKVFQFSSTSPVLHAVCQHFSSLGATTAIERFREVRDVILNSSGDECVSNFTFLMEKLVASVHVLRYDKLSSEICSNLPSIIEFLWKNSKHVEACRLAKALVELLLVAKWYRDGNKSEMQLEKTFSAEMLKCPYMAALTILLKPQSSTRPNARIELSALMDLPSNDIRELCLCSQAVDLISSFLPSYYTYCCHEQMQTMLEFIILQYMETCNLSSLVLDIKHATDCLAEVDILWGIILKLLCRHLAKMLSREVSDKNSIIGVLILVLKNLSTFEEDGESSLKTLSAPIQSFIHQGYGQKWTSKKLGHHPTSLATAICDLPHQAERSPLTKPYAIVVLALAIATESSDLTLFASAIRVLQSLARQTEIRQIFMHVFIRDGFFADQWLFLHEAEYPSELCKDVIEFLCSASEMDCSGSKIFNDDIHNVCPALKYFECQNDVLWSWRQVMRLLVLLSTTRWENLLQCSDHFKDDVFAKIRNRYLVDMVSGIDWKNEELLNSHAERWSILFTCWKAIPRSIRGSTIAVLLKNDLEKIKRFARHLIKGKLQLNGAIVNDAIVFYLKYLTAADERHSLESIIDWITLRNLQKTEASLEVVLPLLSIEKILEMLQSCAQDDAPTEGDLVLVERMMSSGLKERSYDVLVYLTSIFEKTTHSPLLLKCATAALKVFAQTEIERDIVVLCLSLLSIYNVTESNFHELRDMQSLLYSAIHYAHSATNNDQCAVFAHSFVKMLKAVQHFAHHKSGSADEIDELIHGANRLSHTLAYSHKSYYNRVIGSILSHVVSRYDSIQVAIFKLHAINDTHSSSMMATNLPPAERLQYKRIFKTLKATVKPIV
uniref:DUF2428 domain-containing protein n=1 Tax=Haemonchus contortus TaxID=6289 RepID=A0A7I5ECX9_HAECO